MIEKTALPAFLFPPVSWFVTGIRNGEFKVITALRYQKQYFYNRYSIAGANGKQDLIVPVVHSGTPKNLEVSQISFLGKWQREHWGALKSAYNNAPFFEFYDYRLKDLLFADTSDLLQLIVNSIAFLHRELKLEYTIEFKGSFSPVSFETLEIPVYPQVFEDKYGFMNQLSALDLLFNLGPEAGDYLLEAALK